MIKDHGVPGLPQVPEEQEDDAETHHVREGDTGYQNQHPKDDARDRRAQECQGGPKLVLPYGIQRIYGLPFPTLQGSGRTRSHPGE